MKSTQSSWFEILGGLLFFILCPLMLATYVTSVIQCYNYGNSLIFVALVAIPVFGQLIWAGTLIGAGNIFNVYFYLFFAELVVIGIMSLLGKFSSKQEEEGE